MTERSIATDNAGNIDAILIGARIRELRKAQGLSLADLSDKTGLSTGYISQIERDISDPSYRALGEIAKGLGVGISWFLTNQSNRTVEDEHVVRARARKSLHYLHGVTDQLASPNLKSQLMMVVSRIEPGRHTPEEEPTIHDGEEAGFVLEGKLELWFDDDHVILEPGDSYWFPGRTPHRYGNPGKTDTLVLVCQAPPFF